MGYRFTKNGPRCVLTVACGHQYPRGQKRLLDSLDATGYGGSRAVWTDCFPAGAPSHDTCPYGFKVTAMDAAIAAGCTSLLWIDAASWAVKPLGPLFDRIERDGHFFFHGGANLAQRSSDACLAYFGMTRDEAEKIQLIGGTVYGLDLANPRTLEFYRQWSAAREAGAFAGPAINKGREWEMRALGGRPVGWISDDPRCLGHCHDESCATVIASRLGMASYGVGDVFEGYTPEIAARPGIYIVSQGL